MAATTATPNAHAPASKHARKASASQLPSRPTTPLRPASRASLRASQTTPSASVNAGIANAGGIDFSLDRLEPAFAELSESMADLEANFLHLQLLNESIARFNENFAAFLYGLNMTAFCVDFPEAPIPQSFARHGSTTCQLDNSPFRDTRSRPAEEAQYNAGNEAHDATFMTGDTSFVENPPMSTNKPANKYGARQTAPTTRRGTATRGNTQSRGAGSTRGKVPVAGVDENGRRVTRLPSSSSRGRGSTSRGRAAFSR